MEVKLPVIEAGMLVGSLDLQNNSISLENSQPLAFHCSHSSSCCRTIQIPVTDFDIKRIEEQGFALDQIIEVSSPMIRLPKTKHGSIEKNYWIKRKPYDNSCTFLEGNRCSIHEFKPYGCRIFPFSLKMVDENRIKVKIHPSNLCKTVLSTTQDKAQNESLLQELLDAVVMELQTRERYFREHSAEI